jgi:nucleotide-binding universal stress UspA family protein
MLKSLLIGLDDSDDSRSVLELGLRWAKRFDALAVGIAVVDEPGILNSGAVLFSGSHHRHTGDAVQPLISHSRYRAEQVLEQFGRQCREAGVACKTLKDVGTPYVQILLEAQACDLVLLGRKTHFDFGHKLEPDETLGKVIQDSPRPVVAVPEELGRDKAVVVAYDGGLEAARALYAFESSGLGLSRRVHVVSVAEQHQDAAQHCERAVGFLRLHGIEATAHPVETTVPPAEAILHKACYFEAGLLVMGAYGQPVLREFFLGSVTRTVLQESSVPVFCYH